MEPLVISFFYTNILKILLCCLGSRWIAHKHCTIEVVIGEYGKYMQHIANPAKDNSYPQNDQNKFKHSYQTWTSDQIPILCSLANEALSPAKLLPKNFQSEDVDFMEDPALISQTKQNLAKFQSKEFEKLPRVKCFLEQVKAVDGKYIFQNIVLTRFDQGRDTGKKWKRCLG